MSISKNLRGGLVSGSHLTRDLLYVSCSQIGLPEFVQMIFDFENFLELPRKNQGKSSSIMLQFYPVFNGIPWVVPPPRIPVANAGIYCIGIPYKKCYNPGGDWNPERGDNPRYTRNAEKKLPALPPLPISRDFCFLRFTISKLADASATACLDERLEFCINAMRTTINDVKRKVSVPFKEYPRLC